jgi:hypothetical protein
MRLTIGGGTILCKGSGDCDGQARGQGDASFDAHGSTGWLRICWPVRGGEAQRLTFSVHDEGEAIYDSLVLLDNFGWHEYDAVGATDPLN